MNAAAINKGATVYAPDGGEAHYVADLGDEGHLVRPLFDGGDDYYPGSVAIWAEVLTAPPKLVYAEELRDARAELDDLQQRVSAERTALYAMQEERRELQRDQQAVRDRLKENEALRNVDAFLAGKITHFVDVEGDVPKVQTRDEALVRKEDRWEKEIRLLGLFGDEKRGLRWKVTTYGDGSGSMKEVIPCLSLEEAQDRARAILLEKTIPCIRSGKLSYGYYIDEALKQAAALGVEFPQDVADKIAAIRAKAASERLVNARREADRYAKSLADAEAAARAVGVSLEAP